MYTNATLNWILLTFWGGGLLGLFGGGVVWVFRLSFLVCVFLMKLILHVFWVILEVIFILAKGRSTVSPLIVHTEGWRWQKQLSELLPFCTHTGQLEVRCSDRKE